MAQTSDGRIGQRIGRRFSRRKNISVDLWPDVSEFAPEELFTTGFQLSSGKPAAVFSSFRRETVLRHFRWMREHGLDGAFVQRFAIGLKKGPVRHHKDVVLANCREAANCERRAYALMYDLSGLPAGGVSQVMVCTVLDLFTGIMACSRADAAWHHSVPFRLRGRRLRNRDLSRSRLLDRRQPCRCSRGRSCRKRPS